MMTNVVSILGIMKIISDETGNSNEIRYANVFNMLNRLIIFLKTFQEILRII